MSDLLSVLSADLDRPGAQAWLGEAERAALAEERMPDSAIVIGRMLRAGDVRASARGRLFAWLASRAGAIAAAAKAIDGRVARDDAESLLVVVGAAISGGADALATTERDMVKTLQTIDAEANAKDEPARLDASPWLARVASLEPDAWWLEGIFLDRIAATGISHAIEAKRDEMDAAPPSIPALHLPRRAVEWGMTAMLGANEPGGVDEILEKPLTDPVATLCDGDVEVYAHGLGESDAGPPGLVVRHASGDFEAIESVALDPPAPEAPLRSKLDLAFWIPLAGATAAPRKLVVRVKRAGAAIVDELPLVIG